MSRTYGFVNFVSSFGFTRRWRRQCVELARLQPGDRVCDLMTGMGECWDEIRKRSGAAAELTAVDFSPAMIAAARKRLPAYPGTTVIERDVFDTSFAREAAEPRSSLQAQTSFAPQAQPSLAREAAQPRSPLQAQPSFAPQAQPGFDAIVCAFGVKTLDPELYARLAELVQRLLKPGGRFAFVEISVPPAASLRWPLLFYLKWIIPSIGRLCLGNPDNYRMLGVYTRAFGDCRKLHASFVEAGLAARYHRLFFGAATAVSGTKP